MRKGCGVDGSRTLRSWENKRECRNEEPETRLGDHIRNDEIRIALKRMQSGKSVGPNDIPVELWKCLWEVAIDFLTRLFNIILETRCMIEIFGHVQRDSGNIVKRILEMDLASRRQRPRPKRCMDTVREDLQVLESEWKIQNRLKWKAIIRCGSSRIGTS